MVYKNISTFALANRKEGFPKRNNDRGVEQLVARQAHNLEVVRSSRASATIFAITILYEVVIAFLLYQLW